jgi:hypothetical protein
MSSFITYCTKTYHKNEMQVNAVQVYRSITLRSEQTCQCSASVQIYYTQEWTDFHNKLANCSSRYLSISLTARYFRETLNGRDIKLNPDKVFLFLLYYIKGFLLMWDSAELSTAVRVALAVATQRPRQVRGKQSGIYRMPHIIQTVNPLAH